MKDSRFLRPSKIGQIGEAPRRPAAEINHGGVTRADPVDDELLGPLEQAIDVRL